MFTRPQGIANKSVGSTVRTIPVGGVKAAALAASLVGILSGARLSFPACRSLAGSPDANLALSSQSSASFQLFALRQAYPRHPRPSPSGQGHVRWALLAVNECDAAMPTLDRRAEPNGEKVRKLPYLASSLTNHSLTVPEEVVL